MAVKCESGPRPAAHSAKRRFLNCLETSLTPSSTASKASLRDRSRRAKTPWQWSTDDVASATWMPGLGPLTRSPCCCLGSADFYGAMAYFHGLTPVTVITRGEPQQSSQGAMEKSHGKSTIFLLMFPWRNSISIGNLRWNRLGNSHGMEIHHF